MKCRFLSVIFVFLFGIACPHTTWAKDLRVVHVSPRQSPTVLLGIKTDLALWGGVMPEFKIGTWTPNLAVECYFARHWSAEAGYAYSNWNALNSTKELFAQSVLNMEIRHWFGRPGNFKGFFAGAYGQVGQYDVQETLGQTGSFWTVGIGAGWLLPFARHWAVEAEIRGGYRSAKNDIYDIEPEHYYYNRSETQRNFVPQLRINFSYRFGISAK